MSCTRNEIVKQMQAWVGLKESDGSHKKIIDIYNTLSPNLPRGYKLRYTDAWCAGTISALAVACNATDIIPTECSCYYMIEKAKAMGIWVESDAHRPTPGDIIMYDFDDSGKGENTGSPDHVGLVEEVTGDNMVVIEGNYSNSVKRRPMAVNGRYIRGYIVPNYAAEKATETTPKKEAGVSVELSVLRKGSEGDQVKAVQRMLYALGYDLGSAKVDGDFGSKTDAAVRAYQKNKGLTVDGVVGQQTWNKLLGSK